MWPPASTNPFDLLPCIVLVSEREGASRVSFMDAEAAMRLTGNAALEPVAQEARERLQPVMGRLTESR